MTGFIEQFWRSADGLRLYARDYPAAPGSASPGPTRAPVVCLHGLTRNSRDFEMLAPQLSASGRRVLVPDMRGRGRSDHAPDTNTYNPAVYAQDVAGLLDRLDVERAVFVGTSMGGLITMALAAFQPARVAGAVLNDVGPELAPAGVRRIAAYAGRAATVATWDDAAAHLRRLHEVAFPGRAPSFWATFARRAFREGPDGQPAPDYDPRVAAAIDPEAAAPDLWPLFRGLAEGRPVLLIRGAISDLIDAGIAGRMRAVAPHMAYAEVADVGHAPLLDEPEAEAALKTFLDAAP